MRRIGDWLVRGRGMLSASHTFDRKIYLISLHTSVDFADNLNYAQISQTFYVMKNVFSRIAHRNQE